MNNSFRLKVIQFSMLISDVLGLNTYGQSNILKVVTLVTAF